jgi:hypothetical protein
MRFTPALLTVLVAAGLSGCDAAPAPEAYRLVRNQPPASAAPDVLSPEAGDAGPLTDASGGLDGLDDVGALAQGGDAPASADDAGAADTRPDDAGTADTGTADGGTGEDDASGGDATEPRGTFDDPHVASRWPYVRRHTTTDAPSNRIDRYGCAEATSEAGPERVYRLEVETAGTLVAEVLEASGVDVDLHLLAAPPGTTDRTAPCVARDNTRLVRDVAAGTHWLVVDSYQRSDGSVAAGDYTLGVELTVPDAWQVNQLSEGLTWKKKVYTSYAGGRQTINALEVDLAHHEVRPHYTGTCGRTSTVAAGLRAEAAINGGFFDMSAGNCPALDLVKIAGVLKTPNSLTGAAQRCFGVDRDHAPMWRWVPAGADWAEAWHALGAYPNLVTAGAVDIVPEKTSDFFAGRHNRTALGLTASGKVLLVTVDGRTSAGRGMTMRDLAQHMVSLGAVEAVNLDGGGSTTMWIPDGSVNGVVNYPSDNGAADHFGERRVSDLVVVLPRAP